MNHSNPTPTSYLNIPYHLQIAFSQLGVLEFTNGSNPIIENYLSTVDLPSNDNIPWCSAFVNWCLYEAGMDGTGSGLARSFLQWGYPVARPRLGDIVVIKRGMSKVKGHVYLYLDHGKGWIYGIGGNQNDRVGVNTYSSLRLLSYRRNFE